MLGWQNRNVVVTVAEHAPIGTGWIQTEGDTLYYEERGRGRPLLMISGGGGDAGFYGPVASMLADELRVINTSQGQCFVRRSDVDGGAHPNA